MLIKPFGNIKNVTAPSILDSYIGVVVDNNDPQKLGRVRVFITPYDDVDLDALPWACPLLNTFLGNSANSISFSVPEVGSQVRVTFPTKDIYSPYFSGCELNLENKSTFFDEDYPNCYGSKDSVGNFIKINKASKEVIIQHSSTTNVQVAEDGSVMLSNPNGTSITMDSVGNIVIENAKSIMMDCTEYTVTGGVGNFDLANTSFTGDVSISGSLNPTAGVSTWVALPDGRSLEFANGLLVTVMD